MKHASELTIEIDGVRIGQDFPPYVIAEISANHNGSIDRAFEAIAAAKAAGASAVKMQSYTADTMTIDCDLPDFRIEEGLWSGRTLYDLYKEAETPFEWHAALFDFAREVGITLFSTPFDESAVDLLAGLNAPAYKIASFELTDVPLIKKVSEQGKPVILSTGMASYSEIDEAVDTVRSAGNDQICLLHCISEYPTPMSAANLSQIAALSQRYDTIPGLSDHTLGTTASVCSVMLGASVIEKHFTLSRKDKGPDSEFSIEPQELRSLCEESRAAWEAIGAPMVDRGSSELKNARYRRSIYFIRSMRSGQVVAEADIKRIRPGSGLPPKYFAQLIGRRLRVDVTRGTPVTWDVFEQQ